MTFIALDFYPTDQVLELKLDGEIEGSGVKEMLESGYIYTYMYAQYSWTQYHHKTNLLVICVLTLKPTDVELVGARNAEFGLFQLVYIEHEFGCYRVQ